MTVVFITGCSSGIGRALAKTFYKSNCRVIATARQLDPLHELEQMGISIARLDVTDGHQINQVLGDVISTHHRIDILINNAGYGLMGPTIELPTSALEQQFATNVFAPVAIAQAFASQMKKQDDTSGRKGLIVNIGSISGIVPTPFAGAYCASKAALHALTEVLRMELASFGIQVVLVQPGAVQSNFGATATATVQQFLKSDSWYANRSEAIANRANASQTDASPVGAIAQALVKQLLKPSPPPVIRLGKKSLWLPLIKRILPNAVLDSILRKKFGL
ncbi:MAG: SDR family NAD(P)-dependent oxidoreductase [Cyanobacteria bacterium P01_F01_bin.150]